MKESLVALLMGLSAAGCTVDVEDPNEKEELKSTYIDAAVEFTECSVNEGLVLYGAKNCPPCDVQKMIFGPAWSIMEQNYIDCTGTGTPFSKECMDKGIYSVPQLHHDEDKFSGYLFLHQFTENFPSLECKYKGPIIEDWKEIQSNI